MKRLLWSYIFINICFSSLFSEDYEPVFNFLDINSGLLSGVVYDIAQDKQGYMWIGTAYGLCRYDGANTKVYLYNDKDNNSIPNSIVFAVDVDKFDNVWVGTQNGFCVFDKKKNRFYRFNENNSELYSNVIGNISYIDGVMWINSNRGLSFAKACSDPSNIVIKKIVEGNSYSKVTKIEENKVITQNGNLYKMFFDSVKNEVIVYDSIKIPIKNVKRFTILPDKKILLVSETTGLHYIENDTIKKIDSKNANYFPFVREAMLLNNERIILATGQGIYISNGLDMDNIKFNKLTSQTFTNVNISMLGARTICQSNDGTIWVGANGLLSFNLENTRFKNLIIPKGKRDYESTLSSIRTVIEDCNGNILLGTGDLKLVSYNRKNEQYTYLNDLMNELNIKGIQVFNFCKKNENSIYVINYGFGGGIYELDCSNNKYKINNFFQIDNITTVSLSKNENILWTATDAGLVKIICTKKSHKIIPISKYLEHKKGKLPFSGRVIKYHPNGKVLMVGAYNGFYLYHLDENDNPYKYSKYENNSLDNYSISNDVIRDIVITKDERVFIATDFGLNELILSNDSVAKFINFNNKPNMPMLKTMAVIEDYDKNLWINTFNGLVKYDYIKNKSYYFNKYDGLSSNEMQEHSQCITKDGKIFAGSSFGANMFDPQKLVPNYAIATPLISMLNINNKDVEINQYVNERIILTKDLIYTDSIVLTPKEKSFSLIFSALHFTAPQNILYKYKLEGFDNDFLIAKPNENKASYSNLKGGNYKFLVMVSNNDGIWNSKTAVLHIKVIPPLIERLWVQSFLLLFLILILILFFTSRIRKVRHEKKIVEEIVAERTKELYEANTLLTEINHTKDRLFSIIAHDLKNPVGVVCGFSELLEKRYDEYDDGMRKSLISIVNSSSNNLLSLLESILQWTRTQLKSIKVEKHEYSISDQVSKLVSLYTNQANTKGIELVNTLEDNLIVIADYNVIDAILRNLISNAIKFTKEGNVSISFDPVNNILSVIDTGIGMSKEKIVVLFTKSIKSESGTDGEMGTGLGLEICKEFIKLHVGELWIESEQGVGTKISVSI